MGVSKLLFAGWLASCGIRPGERVRTFLRKCPQFAIAHYGAVIRQIPGEDPRTKRAVTENGFYVIYV